VRSPATPPTADLPDAKPAPDAGLRLDRYDNSAFDRGAGRIKEGLWVLCKIAFFLNPFPWPSALRTALLRLFGARLGHGVVVRSGVNITFPWRFTAGDHVWIGEDVLVLSLAPVTLGSHVCVSQRAFLCTGSHAWRRETFDLRTRPIVVGDSVWIAAQAFVGAGVSIGHGCVVSAGAVVTENVPENSLVRGNPAMVVPKEG
jgi:putative colanic acid biosynthesis acetyltransferase WcaF